MSVEVTLRLPESLIEHAKYFGSMMQQNIEGVLSEALEIMMPMWEDFSDTSFSYPPVSTLSDQEVLQLSDSKMDIAQNERLGQLQTKGKSVGLNMAERYELLALIRIYQIGQLRKSEGLAEAVPARFTSALTSMTVFSESIRQRIIRRANNRCEYCLSHQNYIMGHLQVDHIIPVVKGGQTNEDNLCLACELCNQYKWTRTDGMDTE